MSFENFGPLLFFVLVATISPGGATTLATASGANFGYWRSLPLIAGIAGGLGSMAAFAAAGLGTVLLSHPLLQVAMKVAGSLYLLWLAWQIARSGRPRPDIEVSGPTNFIGGVGLLWINPKAWAMTLSAAASFAALADNSTTLAGVLGVAFGAIGFASMSLWCLAGLSLARLLQSEAQWRVVNVTLSCMLAASVIPTWRG